MKKNIIGIIFVLLLIVSVSINVWLVVEDKTNIIVENNNINKQEDITSKEKFVALVERGLFIPLKISNIKNLYPSERYSDYRTYYPSAGHGNYVSSVMVNSLNDVKIILANSTQASELGIYSNISSEFNKEFTINGISKDVVDVCIGEPRHVLEIDYPIVFFLLKDGSVEYLDGKVALEQKNFVVKKLNDISNIVRFEKISSLADRSTDKTSIRSVIAMQSDGLAYDITRLLDF